MKCSPIHPRKRANKAVAAIVICMMALAPSLSLAATATVNFGFSGAQQVAPTPVTTSAPVYRTVQITTERDTPLMGTDAGDTAATSGQPEAGSGSKAAPKVGIGIDAVMSDDLKVYAIPLSFSLSRTMGIQATLPIVTAKMDNGNGGTTTETGLGDISLTAKHRIGSERKLAAFFTLLTLKLPTGRAEKGFGTGSTDVVLTEKVIKRFGDFRGTLMGGLTQPLNRANINGIEVEYGTTLSYMAAVEHTIWRPELWFGLKAAGMHSFEGKIDGLRQGNAVTTLDISPEFSYYFKRNASVNLGVIVPVITEYESAIGDTSDRDVAVNFGVSMLF